MPPCPPSNEGPECRKRDGSKILENGIAHRMEEMPEANGNETLKWHTGTCCLGEIRCAPGSGGGCCPAMYPVCCGNGYHCRPYGPC